MAFRREIHCDKSHGLPGRAMFVNCQHTGGALMGSLANIHTWLGQGRLVRQGISVSVRATWRPAQRTGGPESEGAGGRPGSKTFHEMRR
jgi:hypothetical protein